MTAKSKSILAYQDAKALWDTIYQQSRIKPGEDIIITEPGKNWTAWERQDKILRLNRYRNLLRAQNAELYPRGHPNHGTCLFDQFSIGKGIDAAGSLVIKVYKRTAQGYRVSAGDSEILVDTTAPVNETKNLNREN